MKIRLDPYHPKSKGGRAMARELGVLRTTPKQVRKHGTFDLIINWGSAARRFDCDYINAPEAVVRSSNKLSSLESFKEMEVPAPDYTTDMDTARAWLDDGHVVVERKYLRAHSGRGIRIVSADNGGVLQAAPLYTKYVKKAHEFRVHVFRGEVIDASQKKKRQEVDNEDVNYQVRAARNGWVFCRDNVVVPEVVLDAGVRAVQAVGLDFGAVDIGWNEKRQEPCVYEVNSAPGVQGTTLDTYKEAFLYHVPQLRGGRYMLRRTRR